MQSLNLKPTHKIVKTYYQELENLSQHTTGNVYKEGSVAPLFSPILRYCAQQFRRTFIEQYTLDRGYKKLYLDGAIVDSFKLIYGVWEAKDDDDNLDKEVVKKFEVGYPKDNILFQAPKRAILWQNGQPVLDSDVSQPNSLIRILKRFFEYEPPAYQEWHQAVEEFKDKVKDIGAGLLQLIEQERQSKNTKFLTAFDNFVTTCQENINPNISIQAVEEMLIQHVLTERIFRKVFDRTDFAQLNIIAHEIEKVVLALVTPHGGRGMFFKPLNRFYHAIETTATSIQTFSEKQDFLNTVYEKFFQGFAVKVADKYGIVYTPQPVVKFMVNSVEEILQTEFGRSLSDKNVHILDPFVGTGNFILHIMRNIKKTALRHKYEHELHCNEVMLLPYYIASINIEHEYMRLVGEYKSFEGLCFVDTFTLAEPEQAQFSFMTEENTERVNRQKETPLFVILGNPPYNVGQVNENDNNKNRTYPTMDTRVRETYAKDSQATNKNQLSDVYVKAIRWASNRIKEEGIVAFITNSSFVDGVAFDGMRRHLAQDFNAVYVLDLGGNVRQNPKLSGTTHNVFGIQVGVSITLLVKHTAKHEEPGKVYYARLDEFWRKEQKYNWLDEKGHYAHVEWQEITPDKNYTWLTEGMHEEFETFLPMGTKDAKTTKAQPVEVLFRLFSNGNDSGRDRWVYNFNHDEVLRNAKRFAETYNSEVDRWFRLGKPQNIDEFVITDETQIKWTRNAKRDLKRGHHAKCSPQKIRNSLYRPFTNQFLCSGKIFNKEVAQFPRIFPTPTTEAENRVICVSAVGNKKPFHCLMTNVIPDLHLTGDSQCFSFYTYDKDGNNRQENIIEWTLEQYRTHFQNNTITKWNIFYYIYAILHHPHYREKYAANLKRELPRIPFVKNFWDFAKAGEALANLHVNYEEQDEYPLTIIEKENTPLSWCVGKMKLSKDKRSLIYNNFLTLADIPEETYEYRFGNRSALHWIIDQYRVKTDKRSGIVNDPNREDDSEYIVIEALMRHPEIVEELQRQGILKK